jgi:hypothetical protein
MDAADELTMRELHPFWARATIAETPVEEATRESGLIVPIKSEQGRFQRGVLLEINEAWDEGTPGRAIVDTLKRGTVVFFQKGVKIGDVWVVDIQDILAFEGSE